MLNSCYTEEMLGKQVGEVKNIQERKMLIYIFNIKILFQMWYNIYTRWFYGYTNNKGSKRTMGNFYTENFCSL